MEIGMQKKHLQKIIVVQNYFLLWPNTIFVMIFFKEMDYNKTKKPFLQQKGQKMRRKDNKMNRAQESEYQLPSSKKGNAKDFFKDLDE